MQYKVLQGLIASAVAGKYEAGTDGPIAEVRSCSIKS